MTPGPTDSASPPTEHTAVFPDFPIPTPDSLIVFGPHPDDVAISVAALVILAGSHPIPTTIVQVTDGSEARMPEQFLVQHGWSPTWSADRSKRLRGSIRTNEAREELTRLGLPSSAFKVLENQSWNTKQETPIHAFNDDGSIRDVRLFKAGPIEPPAVADVRRAICRSRKGLTVCAVPEPDDDQIMHRMTTAVVLSAMIEISSETGHCPFGLLTYHCLSTKSRATEMELARLLFEEAVMEQKCHAIRSHTSMFERRRVLGGYSNAGREPYDLLARQWNRDFSHRAGFNDKFAEEYGWLERPTLKLLDSLRLGALQHS